MNERYKPLIQRNARNEKKSNRKPPHDIKNERNGGMEGNRQEEKEEKGRMTTERDGGGVDNLRDQAKTDR